MTNCKLLFRLPKSLSPAKQLGILGEDHAVKHLQSKGYFIRERNHRFHRTEVDIIAQRDDLLVFIEIKTRSNDNMGHPETFVSIAQQARLQNLAMGYIRLIQWTGRIRFDIISILKSGEQISIYHIEDAF